MPSKLSTIDDFLTYIKEQEATVKRLERLLSTAQKAANVAFEKYTNAWTSPMVKYSKEEVDNFENELRRMQNVYCARIFDLEARNSELFHRLEAAGGETAFTKTESKT